MEKSEKLQPIKIAINHILQKKCEKCADTTFCKLKEYYKKIENPSMKNLEDLTKCLYYKKNLVLPSKIYNIHRGA